jgi:hypothetical protein
MELASICCFEVAAWPATASISDAVLTFLRVLPGYQTPCVVLQTLSLLARLGILLELLAIEATEETSAAGKS